MYTVNGLEFETEEKATEYVTENIYKLSSRDVILEDDIDSAVEEYLENELEDANPVKNRGGDRN